MNNQNINPKSPKSEDDKKEQTESPFNTNDKKIYPVKKRQTILITPIKDECSDEVKS